MNKLKQDFGVSALFGTLVIVGAFILLVMGVHNGAVDFRELLPMLGAWISAVLSAYAVYKAVKH